MTLDTLLTWVEPATGPRRATAASGCSRPRRCSPGTILMGAGVSGSGPNYHDSTVTLSKLVPRIARYRDGFYQRLLEGAARAARRAAPRGGREAAAAVRRACGST